jgi:hypothetical protein
MAAIFLCLLGALRSAFRRRSDLILENLALRQQLAVFKHRRPNLRLTHPDRLFWVTLSRLWSRWREVLVVVKPETVVGWHRWAFRRFWTWRSRHRRLGRPPIGGEVRDLIKRMATANEGWGAPRIHGELLKLGIVISEREVSRLMPPRTRKPPSQTWRTFLDNHVGSLASIDFFTVPTATFRILYVFFVLAHDRRRVLHFNVTEHPSAVWTAQQVVEAFPEDTVPKYVIRDRDGIYGEQFRRRVRGLGIPGRERIFLLARMRRILEPSTHPVWARSSRAQKSVVCTTATRASPPEWHPVDNLATVAEICPPGFAASSRFAGRSPRWLSGLQTHAPAH